MKTYNLVTLIGILILVTSCSKEDVLAVNDREDDFLIRLANANRPFTFDRDEKEDQLMLLWFSDIHNDVERLNYILRWRDKYAEYIDDVLFTGDLVGLSFTDNKIHNNNLNGFDKVLFELGNHDVYDYLGNAPFSNYGNKDYWAPRKVVYERYFSNVNEWKVFQPSGAGQTTFPCYYFKDYKEAKIRLIVLDCMYYDEDQAEWFRDVLFDAKLNNYAVIATQHIPQNKGIDDMIPFETPFNSLDSYNLDSYNDNGTRDIVDEFVNNGGEFICWLFGHHHIDYVGTFKSHPSQIYIGIASASVYTPGQDCARIVGTSSEHLFNVICFDSYSKVIKIIRIGAQFDRYLRKRDTMVISYKDQRLLYTS